MQKDLPMQTKSELTEREQEIVRLLASGASNKEIARKLFISANTVKVHLRNIFAKIGVTSRTEAAVYAMRMGLAQVETQKTDLSKDVTQSNQAASTVEMEVTPRRPRLSRGWIALLLGILTLGLASTGFFLSQQLTSMPFIGTTPIPTTFSRWERLADLPTARSGLAVAVHENHIYAIGGETLQGVTGKVESFDPVTNSWQTKSPKPLPVADVEAAMIGGKIFVPGGRLASGEITNIMEVYDPYKDFWELGAALPKALSAYALVTFEGRLYLFGGWDGNQYLDTVFVYDPSRGTWMTRTPMPTRRGFAGAVVVGGKFFVIGGFNGTNALAVSEVYHPDRDQGLGSPWEKGVSLPEGRYALGISSVTDVIYLVGGRGDTNAILQPLLYNPRTNSWKKFEEPILPVGYGLTLVPSGNYLYIIGGRDAQVTINHTLAYQAIYTIMIPVIP